MSDQSQEQLKKKVKFINKIIEDLKNEIVTIKGESQKLRKEIKEKVDQKKVEEVKKEIENL